MRRFRRFRGVRLPRATWFRWVVLSMAIFYLVVRVAEVMVMEPLAIMAEHEARARGIEAVNRIVMSSLGRSVNHNDLISYEKDQSGRIAAYTVNTQCSHLQTRPQIEPNPDKDYLNDSVNNALNEYYAWRYPNAVCDGWWSGSASTRFDVQQPGRQAQPG